MIRKELASRKLVQTTGGERTQLLNITTVLPLPQYGKQHKKELNRTPSRTAVSSQEYEQTRAAEHRDFTGVVLPSAMRLLNAQKAELRTKIK